MLARAAIAPASSRSRFFEKLARSKAGSSMPEADEPPGRQVDVEPLHQLAFGPDAVEGLQQHGL